MADEPIVVDVAPNSPAWLEARRKSLGASDAPSALGFSNWRSARDVALDKWNEAGEQEMTPAMHRGHVLEPAILDAYRQSAKVGIGDSLMLRHGKYEWMTATPDGFTSSPFEEPRTLVEAKSASIYYVDEWGEDGSDEIPEVYDIQVRHAMAVANAESVDVPVVFADEQIFSVLVAVMEGGVPLDLVTSLIRNNLDFRVYTIKRNMEIEASLIEAEKEFWETYIVPHVLPPDLMTHQTKPETIRKATEAEAKHLSVAKKHWLALERAKARVEKKKHDLQRLIGTDEGIDAGDGEKVTWKTKEATRTDWKAVAMQLKALFSEDDHSWTRKVNDIIDENTNTKASRTFLWPWKLWKREL